MLVMLMGLTLAAACGKKEEITLAEVNKFLNKTEVSKKGEIVFQMDMGNTVAVIPFTHINGPKNEWYFYALVNFQYDMETYVKYQVTYLSCTCRDAKVNYWSTAYVELNKPTKPENTRLKALSFDLDGTGHYTAGFWGDSDPIPNASATTYQDIKENFIPLLINKTQTEIDAYSTVDDMLSSGAMDQATYDEFAGASVSTNNIIRILHALFDYHTEYYYGNTAK
jgi:hypothetical protein